MELHWKLVRFADVWPHLTSLALPPESGKPKELWTSPLTERTFFR